MYAECKIENPVDRTRSVVIPKLLVDTGSEYAWVSERMLERIGIQREKKDLAFVLANGQEVTRSVHAVVIDPAVWPHFGSAEAVNAALRMLVEPAVKAAPTKTQSKGRTRQVA